MLCNYLFSPNRKDGYASPVFQVREETLKKTGHQAQVFVSSHAEVSRHMGGSGFAQQAALMRIRPTSQSKGPSISHPVSFLLYAQWLQVPCWPVQAAMLMLHVTQERLAGTGSTSKEAAR